MQKEMTRLKHIKKKKQKLKPNIHFPPFVSNNQFRLTHPGMLTVVMISTAGSPTDFSLKNTKLFVLYADTIVPFSTMLTLSLYLYSLCKHIYTTDCHLTLC